MHLDRKTCKRAVISLFILYLGVYYWTTIADGIGLLFNASVPLLVGLFSAYIVDILMTSYERHYFNWVKKNRKLIDKSRRPVCLIAAILTVLAVIALIVRLVIPELVQAVVFLAREMKNGVNQLLASDLAAKILTEEKKAELAATNWETLLKQGIEFLFSGLSGAAGAIMGVVSKVSTTAITAFTGAIFAIYMLLDKEKLQRQGKRIMNLYLPERWQNRMGNVMTVANGSFRRYFVGQFTEALILGGLCMLGMLIFQFPYAGMIGALIGFTALIPVAGAYIGAAVGAIMMLTVSPLKAVLFLVFILVLQQLEGNLIYPRVVGKSIGLPALWVMAAVTVGGGLMGILGMLIGVPIVSTAYQLLRQALHNKEAKMAEENGKM